MSAKYLSLSILILFWIILECKGEVIVIPGDYPEIQQGIDAAADYDTVLVSPGTYFENLVVLNKNITIGSYFLVDGDTNHISQTIIDGNQSGHVVKIQDVTSSILISGLTITNGRSTFGGGFYIVDSEVSLDHIRIINNSTSCGNYMSGGGGIFCQDSFLELSHFRLEGNLAYCHTTSINSYGGGLYASASTIVLYDGVVSDNQADRGLGGGLCLTNVAITILDVIFENNSSGFPGEAICAFAVDLAADRSVFRNNTGLGEVIFASDYQQSVCQLSLTNCLFTSNQSSISHFGGGLLTIINCTFADNTDYNATVYFGSGDLYIINSIFWNNAPKEIVTGSTSLLALGYVNINGGEEGIENSGYTLFTGPIYDFEPGFADSLNYAISDFSPCIGAGIDSLTAFPFTTAPGYDLDSTIRPNPAGSMPDLGALEHVLGNPLTGLLSKEDDAPVTPLYVYPNPAQKYFKIENHSGETITSLAIHNLQGQVIWSADKISLINKGEYKVDLDHSSERGYLVILAKSAKKTFHAKLIIL